MIRLGVLISGHGSNLQALIDACANGDLPGVRIAVVVCNRRDAYGIQRAQQAGIPTLYFPLKPYRERDNARLAYDADLAGVLKALGVQWVVLAGWMHLYSQVFLDRFPGHVINLHPALPGQFPGVGAIERAFDAARRGEIDHTGVMVHLVPDEAVDAGPVLAVEEIPIRPEDTLEELEARVHGVEHRLLVGAVRKVTQE